MPVLINHTKFAVDYFVHIDPKADQLLVLVLSATFEVPRDAPPRPAEEQPSVRSEDVYWREPGASSMRYEADFAWEKPHVDVLAVARAYAPRGRPATSVPVRLRVGDIDKQLIVFGDRDWRGGPLGSSPGNPSAFEVMPLVYERAFGGTTPEAAREPRNPFGVGFRGAVPADPDIATQVANVEYTNQLILTRSDRPEPAGFGPVGRDWQPRIGFAGTYGSDWLREQSPLLPADFDTRYFQAAPSDQQSERIRGGEAVELINLTPEGQWRFTLPVLEVPLRLRYADRVSEAALRMDTLLLEPDAGRFTMTARARLPIVRNRAQLEEAIFGHVTRAWWKAQVTGKEYLDFSGHGGRLPGARDYRT